MPALLDITGDDIALLNDTDLRALIGMLCEADFRREGLPVSGILWGGNQDASDGGLDVVIRGEVFPSGSGFISRSNTGFQVKKPSMAKNEITREMQPKGELRNEIKGLIAQKGSYIIVSSGSSTTKKAIQNRLEAMRDAVSAEPNHQNLHIDFFDRGRLATWVRSHPAIILWVRQKIGRPLEGWHPYGNWSCSSNVGNGRYIVDEGIRLHDANGRKESTGISILDGISKLREILSVPGTSVRLAGLSGVGKTRFVQAFFDPQVGCNPLDPCLAFYADAGMGASPRPRAMIEQLIALRARAIVIIDNCPPDLHRDLTAPCTNGGSTVSVITIEYDVRDDLPDETSVFRLQPASATVIQKLIEERFPHISQVDSHTIAEFSGGNARLAIALARTMDAGETLAGLRDDLLFERLFRQRNEPNESLLKSAMALSLPYSFNGVDVSSAASELNLLGSFTGKKGNELYGDVDNIIKRDPIQSRDIWRAVLPHAVANYLAKRALSAFPKDIIVQTLLDSGNERIIKSFSKRLSFLHDDPVAQEIAKDWLEKDGFIGKHVGNLTEFGMEVFKNISSVLPDMALDAIERAANSEKGALFASRENRQFFEYVRLLRHLAYEEALFNRAANLICHFALAESHDEKQDSTREVLKSLFYIYLSGTHASLEMRARFIEELLFDHSSPEKQGIGILLLDVALETNHFSSSHNFQFGARPRNYGYQPRSSEEIANWFNKYTSMCVRVALSEMIIADKARDVLRSNFRGLWMYAGIFDALETGVKAIHAKEAWNEGWIAIRETIKFDGNGLSTDIKKRLCDLEESLRPNELLQQARAYALSDRNFSFGLDDIEDDAVDGHHKTEEKTRKIGFQAVQVATVFSALLPEIVSTKCCRVFSFGKGLADGAANKIATWNELKEHLQRTPSENRSFTVFLGFLLGCSENLPSASNEILDGLVADDIFSEMFPQFQALVTIDQRGIERLHKSLELEKAPIGYFRYLAWGRAHETINDEDLAHLLDKISEREDGENVAIEILNMRFHGVKEEDCLKSEHLLAQSRKVLSMLAFSERVGRRNNKDHELGHLASLCLRGTPGIEATTQLCTHFLEALTNNRVYTFDYPTLLTGLAKAQPDVFLSIFLEGDCIKEYQRARLFSMDFERHDNPINQISDEKILEWCECSPSTRYPLISHAIQPFSKEKEGEEYCWKPIVTALIEKAPDVSLILDGLADSIYPTSWSGLRSEILQKRMSLIENLTRHENPTVNAWARRQKETLVGAIRSDREWEEKIERERSQSFE